MFNKKSFGGMVAALVIVANVADARSGADRKMPRQAVHM